MSAAALAVTIWIMVDFLKEEAFIEKLTEDIPATAQGSVKALAGELQWHFRLAALILLNLVVTGIAVILLWRAYYASQTTLRDFQAFASDVLSGMEQGVITTDMDGIITSINRRGLDLLKTDRHCVGNHIDELTAVALKDFRNQWIESQHKNASHDFALVDQGVEKTISVVAHMLKDRSGKEIGNVLQIHDVTEQTLIQDRMRRMERYMGLGSLAGGLHHEIKNPLAALSLHLQLLEEEIETNSGSDDAQQTIHIIGTEVKRIGDVLESFRDFATHDVLNLHEVDLVPMLKQQVDLMRPQFQNQGVQIKFTPSSATLRLNVDQTRLEQVFLNLIVNAMEATPDGGTLNITTTEDDDSISIDFADTGHGVPETLRDKIFDPYFTNKSGGSGLGLAVCDKIVRQHFGTLEFDTSDSGTTFTVKLSKEQQALVLTV